jgi:predicted DNA-binding transcriptional regulator AlpA
VGELVSIDDLIDAHEVAEILGLSHRNSVATYLKRYSSMPRPLVERGGGRTRLWSRRAIEEWNATRSPIRRSRR